MRTDRSIRVILSAICVAACQTLANGVLSELPVNRHLLRDPHFDILVVRVLDTDDDEATNSDPPKSTVEVLEVIRGRTRKKTLRIQFDPSKQGNTKHTSRQANNSDILRNEWLRKPLSGPEVGRRLIVFTAYTEHPLVDLAGAYAYSDSTTQTITTSMAPPERSTRIQTTIFWILTIIPFICLGLMLRPSRPTRHFSAAVLAVLAWLLYLFYEAGISSYSNIRVDLFFIYPALAASGLIALWALACLTLERWRRQREGDGESSLGRD